MHRRIVLAGCLSAFAAPALSHSPAPSVATIQAEVDSIVRRFLSEAGPVAAGVKAPRAILAFTPQLSWVKDDGSELHTAAWSQCPPELQAFFAGLLGDPRPMAPQLFFHEVFNAFLVPHEMSHIVDARRGRIRNGGRLYDGEVHANRVAVAFWRTQPGGEARIQRLMSAVETVWLNLPTPVPANADRVAYFQENYEALLANPAAYGWYQFRLFLDAWDRRNESDFRTLLAAGA